MPKNTPPKLLRCFVGIKFPLLNQIDPLLKALGRSASDSNVKLRITPPKSLHLTLKFLGTVDTAQESELSAALASVSAAHTEFKVDCNGVGFFKDSMWLGIQPNDALAYLVGTLNESLATLGLPAETKSYIPHITVARFGGLAKPKLQKIAERFENKQWGEIKVNKFHLYRSETIPEGAMYYIMNKYALTSP